MRYLFIDLETFSSVDLKKKGRYNYTHSVDFEILLCSYAIDNNPVITIDLTIDTLPEDFVNNLFDSSYLKIAHNASFEIDCFEVYLKTKLDITQWYCTMAHCAYCGLPMSLSSAAKELNVEHQKVDEGNNLIRLFSMPIKPTKSNNYAIRVYATDNPDKWNDYKYYNSYDVEAERDIYKILRAHPLPKLEKRIWDWDILMNMRGVLVDYRFCESAENLNYITKTQAADTICSITGSASANSNTNLINYIKPILGLELDSLDADNVRELIKYVEPIKDNYKDVYKVLIAKQTVAKTSTAKYRAILDNVCSDHRLRNQYQYYGAGTGRWAGRSVQLQNLTKNYNIKDLEFAKKLVYKEDLDSIDMFYGNPINFLSQLIRTSFEADNGCMFYITDFSSIESRVNAYLAGENWKLDVFRTHGKIYEALGARMFKVPIESIAKGSELRDKSKAAELGLGYGGSVGALKKSANIEGEIAKNLVALYRKENPSIVAQWNDFEQCAIRATKLGGTYKCKNPQIAFKRHPNFLSIGLPSGRDLYYYKPKIITNKFGSGEAVAYKGLNATTKQYEYEDTYGGKLCENIVQAFARDLMADAIIRIEESGYPVVLHTHDEIVALIPENAAEDSAEIIDNIMCTPPYWAKGIPIKGEGFISKFYRKDG